MNRCLRSLFALACGLVLLAPAARADHRYFLQSYPPFVSPKGESELSVWTNALMGRGAATNTAWEDRAEYEYAMTNRLTGSLFLNWSQAPGDTSAQHFDGPSLAVVYAFAPPGRILGNPSAYFEVQEDGEALSLYPALLLGQKRGGWMYGATVAGEIATLHHPLPGQQRSEQDLSLTGGISRDAGKFVAFGIEARWTKVYPGGTVHPTAFFAGPTLDLDADKVQLVLGWHPQLSGSPVTGNGHNTSEFAKSEFRMILSIEL